MSQGIVYVASGQSYINKAINSAESIRQYHSQIPITLLTDESCNPDIFTNTIKINYNINEKGDSILDKNHILYDKTLFLDADTRVCGDISDIFDMLDRFHIVAAQNEARSWYHSSIYEENDIDIPEPFPEYNTGVVGYRNSEQVRSLFESWSNYYTALDYDRNQPAFRLALYESEIPIGTLPPEYNFMTHTVGFASGKVRILHQGSSEENLSEWESILNSVPGKKVTTWEKRPCRVVPNEYRSRRYQLGELDKEYLISLAKWTNQKRKTEGYMPLIKRGKNKLIQFIVGD